MLDSSASSTMILLTLLAFLFQVVLSKSLGQASRYVGETITLPSGADPSWDLSKIEWSIFTNNTWIATYRNGKTKTEWLPRYKGRLSLNTSSGDLTIRNLTTNDAMEYTVYLHNSHNEVTNQIKLTVKQHPQKPTIQSVSAPFVNGGCVTTLLCSSPDKIVDFSCQSNLENVDTKTLWNPDGSVFLFTFINATLDDVTFNCTSSGKTEKTWSTFPAKCEDNNQTQPPSQSPTDPSNRQTCSTRERISVSLVLGSFFGVVAGIFIIHCFGGNVKAAWQHLKGKMYSSRNVI